MNPKIKFTKYLKLLKSLKHIGKRGMIELMAVSFSAGWIAASIFVNFCCIHVVNPFPYPYENNLQTVQASLSAHEENRSFATAIS